MNLSEQSSDCSLVYPHHTGALQVPLQTSPPAHHQQLSPYRRLHPPPLPLPPSPSPRRVSSRYLVVSLNTACVFFDAVWFFDCWRLCWSGCHEVDCFWFCWFC